MSDDSKTAIDTAIASERAMSPAPWMSAESHCAGAVVYYRTSAVCYTDTGDAAQDERNAQGISDIRNAWPEIVRERDALREELSKLRGSVANMRRLSDAWRGEWVIDADGDVTLVFDGEAYPIGDMDADTKVSLIALLNSIRSKTAIDCPHISRALDGQCFGCDHVDKDARIDQLRAEVERLTAERDEAREALAIVKADRDKWAAIARERHTLRDEVTALRAELAKVARTTEPAAPMTRTCRDIERSLASVVDRNMSRRRSLVRTSTEWGVVDGLEVYWFSGAHAESEARKLYETPPTLDDVPTSVPPVPWEPAALEAKPSVAMPDARGHRGEFTIGCGFHAGAEITVCGCPPIDSPGAHAYRGLLVAARAEIARLNAELSAARAVPPDVVDGRAEISERRMCESSRLILRPGVMERRFKP